MNTFEIFKNKRINKKISILLAVSSCFSSSIFLTAPHMLAKMNSKTKSHTTKTPKTKKNTSLKSKKSSEIKKQDNKNQKNASPRSNASINTKKHENLKNQDVKNNLAQSSDIKTIKTYKNNNLTNKELKYYQEKIGSDYKIVSSVGASGYWSTTYEIEDKNQNKFILKIPNHPSDKKDWINTQKNTKEILDKYYQNYEGNLKIPHYITIGDDFIIEENLGKQIGKKEFWKNLPKEEVSGFINGMAEFLNFTHNQERGDASPISIDYPKFTLEDACDYLNKAGALNPDDQKMLSDLIEKFKNRDTSDEITCLTHNDIRYSNIVYDNKIKKFALVDFDSVKKDGKLYLGFTSRGMAINGIPYNILSKIIDRYNEISKTKVSKEKIKILHKLGTLYSVILLVKFRNNMRKSTDIFPLATGLLNEFEGGMNSYKICHEVWPFIKETFEEIDKEFEN